MNKDPKSLSPPPLPPSEVSGFCPVHPRNNAIGRCRRCQQTFCDVCENRWQKEPICMACLTRIVEGIEPTPGERESHRREGNTSLTLAIVGWVMFLGSLWMFWSICDGKGTKDHATINAVLFLASFIAPLISAGLAAATLRSRGRAQTPATWGLVLSGLQIGVTLSVAALNIIHN
jgi:hypothetical protein